MSHDIHDTYNEILVSLQNSGKFVELLYPIHGVLCVVGDIPGSWKDNSLYIDDLLDSIAISSIRIKLGIDYAQSIRVTKNNFNEVLLMTRISNRLVFAGTSYSLFEIIREIQEIED